MNENTKGNAWENFRAAAKTYTAYQFARSVIMHPRVIGTTAFVAAYSIGHLFYPTTAERLADMALTALSETGTGFKEGYYTLIGQRPSPPR